MSVPTIGGQGKVLTNADAQAITTPVSATGVAQTGYQYGLLVVNAAVLATAGLVAHLEHSDVVGSGYTAITGATMTLSATGWYFGQLNLDTVKKFVRVVLTGSGATAAAVLIGFPCRDTANYSPTALQFDV